MKLVEIPITGHNGVTNITFVGHKANVLINPEFIISIAPSLEGSVIAMSKEIIYYSEMSPYHLWSMIRGEIE